MSIQVSVEQNPIRFFRDEQKQTEASLRRALALDEQKASLWIHAILSGCPLPLIYCEPMDDNADEVHPLNHADLFTALDFYINNAFPLCQNVPDIAGIKIAGCEFKDLPEFLQQRFENTNVPMLIFSTSDDALRTEARFLLGYEDLDVGEFMKDLSKAQLDDFVAELEATLFFSECVHVSKKSKTGRYNYHLIAECMYVLSDMGAINFRARTVNRYIDSLHINGVPEMIQRMMRGMTDYMTKAFPHEETFLRPTHIPLLYRVATVAIAQRIAPEQFGAWAENFFKPSNYYDSRYYASVKQGGQSEKQVASRLTDLMQHFIENIYNTVPHRKVYVEIDGESFTGEEVKATRVNPDTKTETKTESA